MQFSKIERAVTRSSDESLFNTPGDAGVVEGELV
jgi:hypothetical protein